MTLEQARRTLRQYNDGKQPSPFEVDAAIAKIVASWSSKAKGGRACRAKGQRGERELAAALAPYWPNAGRGYQSRSGGDAPDVDGTPYWLESKRLRPHACVRHYEQAESATDGRVPVVALREDNGPWFVLLKLDHWAPMAAGGQL